jgi:hypothetical protein
MRNSLASILHQMLYFRSKLTCLSESANFGRRKFLSLNRVPIHMLAHFSIEFLNHFVAAYACPVFLHDQGVIIRRHGLKIVDNGLELCIHVVKHFSEIVEFVLN